MGDKEVEMLKQFTQEMGGAPAGNTFGVNELIVQFQQMAQYLSQLEQGIVGLSQEAHAQHLSNQMLVKLLIEKGVCTEGEVQLKWKAEVQEPLRKAAEKLKEKMEEMSKAAEEQAKDEQLKKDILHSVPSASKVTIETVETTPMDIENLSKEGQEVFKKVIDTMANPEEEVKDGE